MLREDLELMRRQVLAMLGAGAVIPLVGCGGDPMSGDGDGDGDCADTLPPETGGPFPGDGTNGPNALVLAGIVRSDIRSSLGGATGVAGVSLTVDIELADAAGCAPLDGRAIYVWHCDRPGRYSMYEAPIAEENYLRGVQVTGTDGRVSFATIFPGCYPGRWPHLHVEIFESTAAAMAGASPLRTSQLAFPEAACDLAYAEPGYEQSAAALAQLSLSGDGAFVDIDDSQLADVTGDAVGGLVAAFRISH
jgi:protocatechuate 3,4-dioxygenase beta subunit